MDLPKGCNIHMVGVCGVGMAGVARLLAARGYHVTGCDSSLNELAGDLRRSGVSVFKGHDEAHVAALPDNASLIVTPAVARDEPELKAARKRGLPVYFRGEVLASLVSESFGIAVCGTHGKTTTACFVTRLFQELGSNPGWCIGGFTEKLGSVASPGDNNLLIVEADESDGTLQFYHPAITVVNNIDIDHLEHFDGEESLVECFKKVIKQSRQGVCLCRDDERACETVAGSGVNSLEYGFSELAALQAGAVEVRADSAGFNFIYNTVDYGWVELGIGGRHNILNALGAAAAALVYGFSVEDVVHALPAACSQLPGRRFEEINAVNGIRFVLDYAHHPVELKVAVEMAIACQPKRLITVFQPHRYTRTLALGDQFPAAFKGVDEVILLPVYAASEGVVEGGDICDLYAHFRTQLPDQKVLLARDLKECHFYLKTSLQSGDMVLIAGAGDVIDLREYLTESLFADELSAFGQELECLEGISVIKGGALNGATVFPTSGRARYLIEVESSTGLQSVIALCGMYEVEWLMVGAGMNSWFSDCGFDGCVLRLKQGCMAQYEVVGDVVEVGCGLSGARLLDLSEEAGLSGVEFMEGVPGSLGGWLAMNAGAHGGEISNCVARVDLINSDNQMQSVPADGCGFRYRSCERLQHGVAFSCTLQLKHSNSDAIKAKRLEFHEKRIPLKGLRTAGSVFRNPLSDSAGTLLDQAGCKEMRIGGAYVTSFHANIIAVDQDAAGSDVAALIQKMRNRVFFRSGIELTVEIVMKGH